MVIRILSSVPSNEAEVDIILVHGLNGDSLTTWTYEDSPKDQPSCCWPLDILPTALPRARILSFGYNANVILDGVKGRMSEYAESLLSELLVQRFDAPSRPIIFVCHSMGGIVVKRALRIANSRDRHSSTYQATSGIIFLATPHRGSKKANYGQTAKNLVRLIPGFGDVIPTKALEELKEFSDVLLDINRDFLDISSALYITSFYEKQPMYGLGLIVEQWSATMEIPAESNIIAVAATHVGICRFASAKTDEWQVFFGQVELLVKQAIRDRLQRNTSARVEEVALGQSPEAQTALMSKSKKRMYASEDESFVTHEGEIRHAKRAQSQSEPSTFKWPRPEFNPRWYYPREPELNTMRRFLTGEEEAYFSIYGLGGVGKTQLALSYIDKYGLEYSHIFWFVADTELKLETSARELAVGLGIVDDTNSDLEECKRIMRQWFDNHDRWLLVLDNVDSTQVVKGFLTRPVKGTVITTSRTAALKIKSIAVDGLQLQPLTTEQGAELLLARIKDSPLVHEKASAEEISKALGGHPLALMTMAAHILDYECSLEDFFQEFRRNREAIIASSKTPEDFSGDYELTLATCWSLSMGPLHGEPAGELLDIVSFMDPDTIAESLLKDYASDSSCSDILSLQDLHSYWTAYKVLRKYALVEKHTGNASSSRHDLIHIHRLVQEAWIREVRDKGNIGAAMDNAIHCLARSYPHQINGETMSDDFPACRALTQHVIALKQHYSSIFGSPSATQSPPKAREKFVALLADAGWFLYETGQWKKAKELFKCGEKLCHQLYGDTPHQLTALIYNNIGVIHDSQNEPEDALSYAMQSLQIREQCLDPDDPEIGNSYSNYGHGLIDLGKYEEAQVYYKKAIDVHHRSKVPSADLLEGAYSCMGKSMLYLGRLVEAEYWLNKAIEWHPHFKTANFFVAETLFAQGSLRMKQNRWKDAECLIRQSLTIRIEVLGPRARLVGVCRHHLGFILAHEDDMEGAEEHLRQAVDIFRVPSETQPGLLQRSMMKLAAVLSMKDNKNGVLEANRLETEVVQLCQQEKSLRHLDVRSEKALNDLVQVAYRCV